MYGGIEGWLLAEKLILVYKVIRLLGEQLCKTDKLITL